MDGIIARLFDWWLKVVTTIYEAAQGPAIVAYYTENPWYFAALHIVFMVATLGWVYTLPIPFTKNMGKRTPAPFVGIGLGGIVHLGLKLIFGFAAAFLAFGIVIGVIKGLAMAGASQVPAIGFLIGEVLKWVFAILMVFVLLFVAWSLAKRAGELTMKLFGHIAESLTGFGDERREDGVKLLYQWLGAMSLTIVLNLPKWEWNQLDPTHNQYPKLSLISTGVGVIAFFTGTSAGRDAMDEWIARLFDRPRKDGAWRCTNHADTEVIVDGVPTGKVKRRKCKGPKGKDPVTDKSLRGWNPKYADACMDPECDYPNRFWQKCHKVQSGCGYGEGQEGPFRRTPNEAVKCPQCQRVWLALPESTGFHDPSEDSYHAGHANELEDRRAEEARRAALAAVQASTPSAAAPAPVQPVTPASAPAPVPAQPAPAAAPAQAAAPAHTAIPLMSNQEFGTEWECDKATADGSLCGGRNPEGDRYCGDCGQLRFPLLLEGEVPTPKPQPKPRKEAKPRKRDHLFDN